MVKKFKRLACLCLTAVFGVTLTAGNLLAFADDGSSPSPVEKHTTANIEDVTGKVDLSDITLKNLNSSVIENNGNYEVKDEVRTLIVTLDKRTVLDYMPEGGDISEYLSSYAGKKAARAVDETQTELLNAIRAKKIGYSLVYKYKTVTNAVAIKVNTQYISEIKSIPFVKSVVVSETYYTPEEVTAADGATNNTLANVYKTGIYNSEKYVNEGLDGSGMTVAILDTGLDYTHPAFSTERFTSSNLGMTKADVAEKTVGANVLNAVTLSANKGDTVTADDLYINEKVPFAYDYADKDADVYPSYSQHGVHVAGIVAGNDAEYKDKDGNTVNESFYGVAPNAQLVICKVFTDDFDSSDLGGATAEDIVAALEDCVNLGVDIINMSLGTSAGFSTTYIDGDDEGLMLADVYQSIKDAGISLMCAASNDYSSGFGSAFGTNRADAPDSGTVGSPSTFVGAMSVASINGQLSPYMVFNDGSAAPSDNNKNRVYFQDASDANGVKQDFISNLLGEKGKPGSLDKATFKYVVIGGYGKAGDYTRDVIKEVETAHNANQKVIALVARGSTTFKDKVLEAMDKKFDAVIIHNNVAGTVGMTYGDIKNPIPAITVTLDAGRMLRYETTAGGALRERLTGEITLDRNYEAGPFMNDYSSWGATPDLKLKPEITAHGGEITSTVSGGYDEMSGTSMATPNLAGFTALLRSYLIKEYDQYIKDTQNGLTYNRRLNQLINQLMMSTAKTVYDQNELPYSPRKQGAGLATLDNVFSTGAYCWTDEANGGAEDNRPKIELGYDESCKGVKDAKTKFENLTFKVTNFGTDALKFKTQAIFMTETLSADGLAVAEQAYILDDIPAQWKITRNGGSPAAIAEGAEFEVASGETVTLSVTLELSPAEQTYIQKSFTNGMYVEGFLKLLSLSEGQCDLNVPFMGFYGNWKSAPLLDYDCYEISDFQKNSKYTDETRPQPRVFATQMYLKYYNNDYSIPMGGFAYIQDDTPGVQKIYTEREHASVSCYNVFNGENSVDNYMTTTEIRGLYTGLLRNCEIVTYDLYDDETGELISGDNCVYTIEKAFASGGSARPANVEMELNPFEMGLKANGKYRLDYKFYFEYEDYKNNVPVDPENTVSMSFYVDYEAPVLQESRIRYFDYKDGNRDKQRIYLDLDIYDNHYPQAVVLCYAKREGDMTSLDMVTRYATPVYNAVKNGTSTVSIEITDLYEKYGGSFYVQIDDYALNHSVWRIDRNDSNTAQLPDSFDINGAKELTIGVNQATKLSLNYEGEANLSNFTWTSSRSSVVRVNNGEIFGVAPGTATVTVRTPTSSKSITVKVVESNTVLSTPNITFGTIVGANENLEKAQGAVDVNAGQRFKLDVITDPWYYVYSQNSDFRLKWATTDPSVATVDQNGWVTTLEKWGSASITATIMDGENETAYAATVTLNVQEPFTVSNYRLTKYHGWGGDNGVLTVPDDKNIMYIGEDAFKDNDNVRVIILPKTLTQIDKYAFRNCTALEEVYFISQNKIEPANASLSLIMDHAFYGCNKLKKLDLSNCKTISIVRQAFEGCTALEEVVEMTNAGTMGNRAFAGCTSLKSADISGLHTAGVSVFEGCTALDSVITAKDSAIGARMFAGCTSLKSVEINAAAVGAGAFAGCTELGSVTFNGSLSFTVGDEAFRNCTKLSAVYNANRIVKIGDKSFTDTPYYNSASAVYSNGGKTLVFAPAVIDGTFNLTGVTEIAPYAFSSSRLASGITTIDISGVEKIGEGAFAHLGITSITLPSALTEIAPHAFEDTALVKISVPAGVKYIGNYAFAACASLNEVTFAAGSALYETGDGVFAGCTSLTSAVLPEGLKVMGSLTFGDCANLLSVSLPAVEGLGDRTFTGCAKLASVTFAEGASTTGTGTFGTTVMLSDGTVVFDGCKALTSVTLGKKIKEIGAYAFAGCTALENLDISGATTVGMYAFAGCTGLSGLTGLNKIVIINEGAFINCTKLLNLDLASAQRIGKVAFTGVGFTSLKLDSVISIGSEAFLDGKADSVNLPASLAEIGAAAFARSSNLRSFTVDEGNKIFFAEDGVLYRNIAGQAGAYELCSYPSAKVMRLENEVRLYEIKEGTVSVQGYAFAVLNDNTVTKVKLPYSVKVLGSGAFNGSKITELHFESINAPVLLTEAVYDGDTLFYGLYYNNFGDYFLDHYDPDLGPVTGGVAMKIYRPTNGLGYDNFIFSNYFSSAELLGELMEDATRNVKDMIESFVSPEEVKGWLNLDVNTANTQTVTEFSERVKEAHRVYNTIRSEGQLALLGAENAQKLFAIEAELRPVKQKFGIPFKVESLSVSADSTYKTEYGEGERFNPAGLIIIVTYDDYSTEIADMTKLTLSSSYDRELTILDRYVEFTGYGQKVKVPVTVKDGAGGSQGGGAVNPAVIYGPVIGVVVVAAAVAATLILLKKKKAGVAPADTENSVGTQPETDKTADDGKNENGNDLQTTDESEK